MRHSTHLAGVMAALAIALFPQSARAEDLVELPRHRQGYYLSAGAHGGLMSVDEPMAGLDFSFKLGQLLTTRFGLGLMFDFGSASSDAQDLSFGGLTLMGQAELVEDLALHAGVGLGIVTLTAKDDEAERGAYGANYVLGVSYDWFFTDWRTGGFALTPELSVRAQPGDLNTFGGFVGLQFTWWTGLPENQLDLDAPAQ